MARVPLAMDTLLIPDSIGAAHFVLASSMEMGSLVGSVLMDTCCRRVCSEVLDRESAAVA
ncbi:hypothetical protein ACLOJK_041438 [Asimina triloba]